MRGLFRAPAPLVLNRGDLVVCFKTSPHRVLMAAGDPCTHPAGCAPQIHTQPLRQDSATAFLPSSVPDRHLERSAAAKKPRSSCPQAAKCGRRRPGASVNSLQGIWPRRRLGARCWELMKQPVCVLGAHGPNYWCLCANPCSAGRPGGEAGCPAQCWQGAAGGWGACVPHVTGTQPLP